MTSPEPRLTLRADRLVWREAGEEVVALDRETSEYLAVNQSGIDLWRALAGGATRAELAIDLRERWGLSEPEAERDVARFVDALVNRGLVRAAAPSS